MKSIAVLGAFVTASALLSACSTLPEQPSIALPLAPRAAVVKFTAAGRVSARVTDEDERGFSGGFSWAHKPTEDVIELMTPLGQLAVRMTLNAAGADIELSGGRRIRTSDPEKYLTDAFGVSLPVAALPFWMQAVPVASVPYRAEGDALGRPATLWQSGWAIQYTAYFDETTTARPTRMQLTRGNVEARMIVSEWSLE